MRRAGIGRLYELFVRLREKLAGEGLFDEKNKRSLPRFPRRVGLITSPQAAALRDVIAAFARRAPHVELIVYPTLVQGAEAPAAIVAALGTASARNECDLLLIVRGGGSIEDLWAFNNEAVARAIAAHCAISPAPIISGIGHETDTTIADYVADRRAATPTAAAELASAGWFEAAAELAGLTGALRRSMQAALETRMQTVDRLALRLLHPAQRLASSRQRVELLTHRLRQAMHQLTTRQRDRLSRCSGALSALSPLATLQRGYSIVRTADGKIVRDAGQLAAGATLQLRFAAGEATAVVKQLHPDSNL
jgi:exodeoxyribonuclease VII large subunit